MKKFLIHLLGGLTVEESRESDNNSYTLGRYTALNEVKEELRKSRSGQRMAINDFISKRMSLLRNEDEA